MEIILSKTEKVYTDEHNWIFSTKYKNKWENKWYYSSLENCYFDLLDYFTRTSSNEELIEVFKEVVDKLESLKKEIQKKA